MTLLVIPSSAGSLSTQNAASFWGFWGSTATTGLLSLVVKPPALPNSDEMFCGPAVAAAAGIVASRVLASRPSSSTRRTRIPRLA